MYGSILSHTNTERGFSLIEVMIALIITVFGLLAAGQLLFVAASSHSLARSKGAAALIAQNKLEVLSDLYSREPSNDDLSPGNHGPEEVTVINPNDGNILNCFRITWTAENVPDPRPGIMHTARVIKVTVTPVQSGGVENKQPWMNKVVNITTIFSPVML
jgi:prepilin-type N-terminal cleavage/methylation domain-containing protein